MRLFCDVGHLGIDGGDYPVIRRGSVWRIEPSAPVAVPIVEGTGPDSGGRAARPVLGATEPRLVPA